MLQIPSSPSTKKISEIIGMIKREELILQPEFQRKLVWNDKHKELFIDTILKGFPFPEVYIAQSGIDLETLQSQQVVVDGQQRLSSIVNYIEGTIPCKTIPPFAGLTKEEKECFLNYDVVIRDLKNANADTIKEVFRRINQTKYNLSSIEIHNALYDGEFISTGKEILNNFDNETIPVFNDTDISRMGDLYYILLLMATYEEGGYFSENSLTEKYIKEYDNEYGRKDYIKSVFLDLFNQIVGFGLEPSSMWFRKSNFFTLFIELLKAKSIPSNIAELIVKFEENVVINKGSNDNDFGVYYSSMYTGTNSRSNRIQRGMLFRKHVLGIEELSISLF